MKADDAQFLRGCTCAAFGGFGRMTANPSFTRR